MLRPATPLAVLLLVAFVLLLLSTLSAPIIKSFSIGQVNGVDFGVFGYCQSSGCSRITVGYSTDGVFNDDSEFSLKSGRRPLTALLIVHPIATLLTLILLILAIAAHTHSPSHSTRFLTCLLLLTLPTLLLSLLAFLVDVLLFTPHVAWGGWIVLAATLAIAASGIVTCAMRRTLVSRKARKRRIAQNAEMSGENFYNRQAAEERAAALRPPPINAKPTVPDIDVPTPKTFATMDTSKEEWVPLTTNGGPNGQPMNSPYGMNGRPSPMGRGGYMMPNNSPYGPGPGRGEPRMPFSNGPGGSPYGPGPGFGYGPGRGGPWNRGGPYRGGMNGRGRGMPPPMGMMGRGRGPPPPPGFNNGRGGPIPYDPRTPSPGPGYANGYGGRRTPPELPGGPIPPRGPSPGSLPGPTPPLTRSSPPLPGSFPLTPANEAPHMTPHDAPPHDEPERHGAFSPSSVYSNQEGMYVPARAAWDGGRRTPPLAPFSSNHQGSNSLPNLNRTTSPPTHSRNHSGPGFGQGPGPALPYGPGSNLPPSLRAGAPGQNQFGTDNGTPRRY